MWGIWREQLPEALLWRSWDDTATRLLPLLAPTVSLSGNTYSYVITLKASV